MTSVLIGLITVASGAAVWLSNVITFSLCSGTSTRANRLPAPPARALHRR